MATIINLYGGPGTGKSTSAAFLFYRLKKAGKNAELVREYAKDWAWDKRAIGDFDQIYLLGKQIRRESMLYNHVDYLVTDCPVLSSAVYAGMYSPILIAEGVRAMIAAYTKQVQMGGHVVHHLFLTRSKDYNPAGRYQTESEARVLDDEMKIALKSTGANFKVIGTDESSLLLALTNILDVRA